MKDVVEYRLLQGIELNVIKSSELTPDEFPYNIEVIAEQLTIPWGIAISPDGRMFITERLGTIRVIQDGKLLSEPLISFPIPTARRSEGGLLGIALDPNFSSNHYIYVYRTVTEDNRTYNQVIRLLEADNKASIDRIIIDNIPGSLTHDGGRIKVGPDQKLYITTGDAGNSSFAQDLDNLAGKILRINLDGSIPIDNPIHNSPIYSFGFRNPQGLDWNAQQVLYASEHGQTAHDEINIIQPGTNYGWPLVQGEEESQDTNTQKPLLQSEDVTWAPAGIAFVKQGPWNGKLLVATLRGEQLLALTLNENGTKVIQAESWLQDQYGRLRDVVWAEDGSIYLSTSNRDGRGFANQADDRILRLVPKEQ